MQRTAQTHSLTHTHEKIKNKKNKLKKNKLKIKIKYDKTLEHHCRQIHSI